MIRATRRHLREIRKEFKPKPELIKVKKGNTREAEDQLCFCHFFSAPSDSSQFLEGPRLVQIRTQVV